MRLREQESFQKQIEDCLKFRPELKELDLSQELAISIQFRPELTELDLCHETAFFYSISSRIHGAGSLSRDGFFSLRAAYALSSIREGLSVKTSLSISPPRSPLTN
jgi:hypothetical protein